MLRADGYTAIPMTQKPKERACSLHWPLVHSLSLPGPSLTPAGLTYHRSKLDSISQAHSRSSVRIPANMRGVQLCIVWCRTLKAEQECGDQDRPHRQSTTTTTTTTHCIAWVQASVEPTRTRPCSRDSWPDPTATTITSQVSRT